ncbi:glycosyltransferase family A protein [Parapedobacter sp. GCM10030251]|uniref:glycosyltransferase family A protein n=1 Tax=Parapedobacter sp. GCM10030251 TaxID=3273419 RepID=UPI003610F6CF
MSTFSLLLSRVIPLSWEKRLREIRDSKLRRLKIEKLPEAIYAPDLTYYKISLCITCMNRLYQLEKTLLQNIHDNIDYPNLEICLVNYNSTDNLDSFIREKFKSYIDKGILRYIHTTEPKTFHASKAKNLAHYFSTGDVVCNVDGDNFTGKDFAFYLNYLFNTIGEDCIVQFKRDPLWGTVGRIALSRKNFLKLGGYSEDFYPTGFQDYELRERAVRSGLTYKKVQIDNFLNYISNSRDEKIKNLGGNGKDWDYYDQENRKIFKAKAEKNIFVSNTEIDRLIDLRINFENVSVRYKPYQP